MVGTTDSEPVLDPATVEAFMATSEGEGTQDAARAWLLAYDVARSLGFGEQVGLQQATQRWDLTLGVPLAVYKEPAACD